MVAIVYGIFIKVNMQLSHGSVMGFDVAKYPPGNHCNMSPFKNTFSVDDFPVKPRWDMNSFSGEYDILGGGSSTWIKSPQVSG